MAPDRAALKAREAELRALVRLGTVVFEEAERLQHCGARALPELLRDMVMERLPPLHELVLELEAVQGELDTQDGAA